MTDESDKGKLPFGALVMDYEQACEALTAAQTDVSIAQNKATDALNRVNDLQRKIAGRYEQMEKSAPLGSDWQSVRAVRYPA